MEVAVYCSKNTDDEPVVVIEFDGNALLLDAEEARGVAAMLLQAADMLDAGGNVH